jgi:cystathionine beta-lyase/cystathionine gamma-synthase
MSHDLLGASAPLVPPLYQTAVYTLPDLDALDRIYEGQAPGYIYARDGHPNAQLLAAELARLEAARWGVICGSGMAALAAALLACLQQGDRVLASNRLYGRTETLIFQELARLGVRGSLVDACDLDSVAKALETPARVLIVETLSNPLLRIADVPRLAQLCHARGCLLLVDNTFATPALFRPLEHGADLVVESLTKLTGGHSDVTLGAVCGSNDLEQTAAQIVSIWGMMASPFDCWLAQRGLASLPLRLQAACDNAARLAEWLAQQAGVVRVVYPGLPDHPDHALARQLFGGHFGNMLCFELAGGREAVNAFLRQAQGIPFSPSLGHTFTTVSHPATTSHRYVSPAERRRQGISDGLLRLSVGFEPFPRIQDAVRQGLGG